MATRYLFRDFVLEAKPRPVLSRAGERVDASYIPLKLLHLLLAAGGERVSVDALQQGIWPKEATTGIDLKYRFDQAVTRLKRILGDDRSVIQNIMGEGYYIDATVDRQENDCSAAPRTEVPETINPVAAAGEPVLGAPNRVELLHPKGRLTFTAFPDIDKLGTLAAEIRAWQAKGTRTWHRFLAELFRSAGDEWSRIQFFKVLIDVPGTDPPDLLPELTDGRPEAEWNSETKAIVQSLHRAHAAAVAQLTYWMTAVDDPDEARRWLMEEVLRLLRRTPAPGVEELHQNLPDAEPEFTHSHLIQLATKGQAPEEWDEQTEELVRRIRDTVVPYLYDALERRHYLQPGESAAIIQWVQEEVDELLERTSRGRKAAAADTWNLIADTTGPLRFDGYPDIETAPILLAQLRAWRTKGMRRWLELVAQLFRLTLNEASRIVVMTMLRQWFEVGADELVKTVAAGRHEKEWDDDTRALVVALTRAEAEMWTSFREIGASRRGYEEGREWWFMRETLKVLESCSSAQQLREHFATFRPNFGYDGLLETATAGVAPEEWSKETQAMVRRIRDLFVPFIYGYSTDEWAPDQPPLVGEIRLKIDKLLERAPRDQRDG